MCEMFIEAKPQMAACEIRVPRDAVITSKPVRDILLELTRRRKGRCPSNQAASAVLERTFVMCLNRVIDVHGEPAL